MLQRERQGVLFREIHVGFIQHDHAAMGAAESVEFVSREGASARCVRRGDERECGVEVPRLGLPQDIERRQLELFRQTDGIRPRAVNRGQHRIEGITRREILDGAAGLFGARGADDGGLWLHERPRRQREQFIRAIADDDVLRRAAMEFRQLFAQRLGGWIRIKPEASVHRRLRRS